MLLILDLKRGIAAARIVAEERTAIGSAGTRQRRPSPFSSTCTIRPSLSVLPNASVDDLELLLRLVYAYIRPERTLITRAPLPRICAIMLKMRVIRFSALFWFVRVADAYRAMRRIAEDTDGRVAS